MKHFCLLVVVILLTISFGCSPSKGYEAYVADFSPDSRSLVLGMERSKSKMYGLELNSSRFQSMAVAGGSPRYMADGSILYITHADPQNSRISGESGLAKTISGLAGTISSVVSFSSSQDKKSVFLVSSTGIRSSSMGGKAYDGFNLFHITGSEVTQLVKGFDQGIHFGAQCQHDGVVFVSSDGALNEPPSLLRFNPSSKRLEKLTGFDNIVTSAVKDSGEILWIQASEDYSQRILMKTDKDLKTHRRLWTTNAYVSEVLWNKNTNEIWILADDNTNGKFKFYVLDPSGHVLREIPVPSGEN